MGIYVHDVGEVLEVSHCTFFDMTERAIYAKYDTNGTVIRDNIITSCGTDGIKVYGSENLVVEYNDFWDNPLDIDSQEATLTFPIGNIYLDPLFEDTSDVAFSLALLPGSPCIDAASDGENMGDLRWRTHGPVAPIITSPASVHAYWNYYFSYRATASNPDEHPLTWYFNPLPSWLSVNADSVFGTPSDGDVDATFQVIVTADSLSDSLDVTVIVHAEPNQAPQIISPATVNAEEDVYFCYYAMVNDPDGPELSWTYTDLSIWLTANADSVYGTPVEGNSDTSFTITASDGFLNDTLVVAVNIAAINDPPVITSVPTIYVEENEYFIYHATATDPDGPTLSWTFEDLPLWLSAAADSVFGTPPAETTDTSFRIIASDGYLNDTLVVNIILGFEPWKFIVYGDTRNNPPRTQHSEVLQSIVANTPDYKFIINVGDVVDHGEIASEWEGFYQQSVDILSSWGQDMTPPEYMATPGNHDNTEQAAGLANWNSYLSGQVQQYGNQGKFFTFDYENARFIVLDSDKSSITGTQYSMLMDAIQNNPKTWLFAIWHHPIFAFGEKSYQGGLHDTWGIPLYQNGCDIFFAGHEHYYVRTKKLELNGVMNPPLDSENGTVQVVTGNSGAPIDIPDPNHDGNNYFVESYISSNSQYGYTELTVGLDSLQLRHYLRDGTIFDEVYYTPNSKNTGSIGVDKSNKSHFPDAFHLYQNYPNPFNPVTSLQFSVPVECHVNLSIYDLRGHLVSIIVDDFKPAGTYGTFWNGTNSDRLKVPSGIYFFRMLTSNYSDTKKLILMR